MKLLRRLGLRGRTRRLILLAIVLTIGLLLLCLGLARDVETMLPAVLVSLPSLSLAISGLLIIRSQRRRIRTLSRTARAIRDGNLAARADLRGRDEIARLGHDFDSMAQEIEDLAANLAERQQHLEEKTATLSNEIRCRKWLEEERRSIEAAIQSSQKMEAIGQLAAGIAHELNTPLQYIGDNLSFVRDSFRELLELVPSPQRDQDDARYLGEEVPLAIGQSVEGLRRITEIVSALREFAQPVDHHKHMVDVRTIVRNTVTVSRSAWSEFCEIDLDLGSEPLELYCHSGEIGQCLLNIIVNATEAIQNVCSEEKGLIRISCGSSEREASIIIEDNGSGMSEDVQRKVFNLFFTTKSHGTGRGQGLAMAHRSIVKRHGGSIDVTSRPGRGSRFTIRIPRNSNSDLIKDGEQHETRPVGR